MGAKRKLLKAFAKRIPSSSEKILIGQKLQGRIIKNVYKGEGDIRMIVFEDGFQEIIDKDILHSLSSAAGREQYGEIFKAATPQKKREMFFKSIGRRYEASTLQKKPLAESRLRSYKTKSQMLDDQKTESLLVRHKVPGRSTRFYQAPDYYAKPGEKAAKDQSFKILKKQPKPKRIKD